MIATMKNEDYGKRKSTAAKFRSEALTEYEESYWGFWYGGPDKFDHDGEDRNLDATTEHSDFTRMAREGDRAGLSRFLEAHPRWDVDAQDSYWRVPLHESVRGGHLECVEFLLGRKASLSVIDRYGQGALHEAGNANVPSATRAIVELLVSRGAPLEGRDVEGRTPFLAAAAFLSVEAASALADLGCDTGARDARGKDAWDIASRSRRGARRPGMVPRVGRSDSALNSAFLGWLAAVWERMELVGVGDGDGASLREPGKAKTKSL